MKRIQILVLLLALTACTAEDEPTINDIFHRWKWVKTNLDGRGTSVTAPDVDSTFYYEFTQEGQLRILNNSVSLAASKSFTLSERNFLRTIYFPEDSTTWAYVIRQDTLTIWSPTNLWSPTEYFVRK